MEENKRSSHIGFKIFIIGFLILSMIFLKEENQNKIIGFLDSLWGKEKVLKLTDSFEGQEDIISMNVYDGNIVVWRNNKISFLKSDGTLALEKEFNFVEPSVYYGDKYIYIMDNSTGDIYSLDKKGQTVDRLQLNKEIYNIKETNENLIYHIKTFDLESINILNKNKVLIGNHSFENENILSYATNKNGNMTLVSLLNLKGDMIKSHLYCYGENNEKLNSLSFQGEILLFLEFTSKEEIVALTDKGLYFIKDGKIMWKKQFDIIKDICVWDNKIYILYSNYLETIDFTGRVENKIGFAEEYNKIVAFDKKSWYMGTTT